MSRSLAFYANCLFYHDLILMHICEIILFLNSINTFECYVEDSVLILRNDYPGSSSWFFHLPWTQYQQEFGSPTALYWMGLDRLHQLTQGNCQVRFDLQDRDGTWYYALYSSFSVGDSSNNYLLTIGGYSGDAGDAMAYHNGLPFSTYDADHDGDAVFNWASLNGGGFWFSPNGADAYITTSSTNFEFYWTSSTRMIYVGVVEVSLLCQWVASEDDDH